MSNVKREATREIVEDFQPAQDLEYSNFFVLPRLCC